jgi:hypothetical protein
VSFASVGLCVPVNRDTPMGKNTNADDNASATTKKSSMGKYCDKSVISDSFPKPRKLRRF